MRSQLRYIVAKESGEVRYASQIVCIYVVFRIHRDVKRDIVISYDLGPPSA